MKRLIPMSILLLSSLGVQAQTVPEKKSEGITAKVSALGQSRYFQIADGNQLTQYNLTLKGSVDLDGVVTIHSMVQTGNGYNVGFGNIYNHKTDKFNKDHNLYVKRLYLEKNFMDGKLNMQAGAMGTRKSISNTNKLSNIGWIDGARAMLKTDKGNIVVTAGQIDKSDANMFHRAEDAELNYFEVAVTTELMENLLAEAGVEVYDGETYIQLATNYDIEVAAGRILKIVGDAKVQTSTGGYKVGAGIADLVTLIRGKKSAVKLSVNYEYVKSNFNAGMNSLSNGMHTGYTGGAFVMKSSFPISKKYGVTGFTNIRVGNTKSDLRVEVGIKKSIFNKKSKKRRRKKLD